MCRFLRHNDFFKRKIGSIFDSKKIVFFLQIKLLRSISPDFFAEQKVAGARHVLNLFLINISVIKNVKRQSCSFNSVLTKIFLSNLDRCQVLYNLDVTNFLIAMV